MRGYALLCTVVLAVACSFPTARERAIEEPDRFERFNALAELDSIENHPGYEAASDPTAALPGWRKPMSTHGDLRPRMSVVLRYLRSVDERLRACGIIPRDTLGTPPWEGSLDAQTAAVPSTGWSIELWSEPHIGEGSVANRVRCNALGMSQPSLATLAPTLSIKKPVSDLRFDWFITTGDSLRDRTIIEIVKAEALSF